MSGNVDFFSGSLVQKSIRHTHRKPRSVHNSAGIAENGLSVALPPWSRADTRSSHCTRADTAGRGSRQFATTWACKTRQQLSTALARVMDLTRKCNHKRQHSRWTHIHTHTHKRTSKGMKQQWLWLWQFIANISIIKWNGGRVDFSCAYNASIDILIVLETSAHPSVNTESRRHDGNEMNVKQSSSII